MTQSKYTSFLESLSAASLAAPTAILLHKFVLWLAGDCALANAECNNTFLLLAWGIFWAHSIAWKYIIRRVYEKYDVQLNPIQLYRYIKKRLK